MWVSTFAVSALASNFERMGKPFNPLLGETYELKRPDFRIVCEQVSMVNLTEVQELYTLAWPRSRVTL